MSFVVLILLLSFTSVSHSITVHHSSNASVSTSNKLLSQTNHTRSHETNGTHIIEPVIAEKDKILKKIEAAIDNDDECRSADQIIACIRVMHEDRRDTSDFTRSLEVSCCIYAKFADCIQPLVQNCPNDTTAHLDQKILKEAKYFDDSCKRYEYPSARCWIFFHQWCFFAIVFACLTAFGLFLAAVATKEGRRRQRIRSQGRMTSIPLSRVHEAGVKPHLEFPPPPSYEECV